MFEGFLMYLSDLARQWRKEFSERNSVHQCTRFLETSWIYRVCTPNVHTYTQFHATTINDKLNQPPNHPKHITIQRKHTKFTYTLEIRYSWHEADKNGRARTDRHDARSISTYQNAISLCVVALNHFGKNGWLTRELDWQRCRIDFVWCWSSGWFGFACLGKSSIYWQHKCRELICRYMCT